MSYILDAMRKTVRDRTLGQAVILPAAGAGWRSSAIYIGVVLVATLAWYAVNRIGFSDPEVVVGSEPQTRSLVAETPVTKPAATITVTPASPAKKPAKVVAASPPKITKFPRVTVAVPTDWRELPDIGEIADQLLESLVQVRIGIHVYDDAPLKRMVLINGRRYRQGDTLLEGAKIIEITPAGIVLSYQGRWFLKRG